MCVVLYLQYERQLNKIESDIAEREEKALPLQEAYSKAQVRGIHCAKPKPFHGHFATLVFF